MNLVPFYAFPKLETQRLLFGDLADADHHEILHMRSDPDIYRYLDRQPAQSPEDVIKFIGIVKQAYDDHTGISWSLMNKSSKEMAGYIGLWRIIKEHNRGEIGYALKKKFWGQGLMQEAINAVTRFGFQKLELHSIEANVNPANQQSIRVLEKCRFKKEAYFRENYCWQGKYIDSVIYSLLEKDLTD